MSKLPSFPIVCPMDGWSHELSDERPVSLDGHYVIARYCRKCGLVKIDHHAEVAQLKKLVRSVTLDEDQDRLESLRAELRHALIYGTLRPGATDEFLRALKDERENETDDDPAE